MRPAWLGVAASLFAAVVLAQVCAGPGKDGPNAALNGTVNSYYPGTANVAAGNTAITLGARSGAATALSPGDMVLVMQMQDGVNVANFTSASVATYGNAASTAGKFEYGLVDRFAGGVLTLRSPLVNSYSQAVGVGVPQQTFQVIRVPQYSSASVPAGSTVTAALWNGLTGGVVAIDVAAQLTLAGAIDVSGYGFRGGGGQILTGGNSGNAITQPGFSTNEGNGAMKGEGTAGTPCGTFDALGNYIYNCDVNGGTDLYPADPTIYPPPAGSDNGYGAPGNAGGGGNDGDVNGNTQNSGGGGGGNAGAGGQGGNTWSSNLNIGGRGGWAFAASASAVVMGGGGGAGVSNNGVAGADNTYSGAPGGGIVMVRAGSVSGAGRVLANGFNGQLPNAACCDDGGTGGGAGGSVVLLANNPAGWSGISVSAAGGNGSNTPKIGTNAPHGPGGGGGGGAVLSNGTLASTTLTGGASGLTSGSPTASVFFPYNATPGTGGAASTIAFNSASGTPPGAVCLPVLTVSKTTSTPLIVVPPGTTASYTINVRNGASAGAAYGVAIGDVLPLRLGLAALASTASISLNGTNTVGPSPTTPNRSGTTATAVFGVAGSANAPTSATPSFTIFPGGSVTATFVVNLNTTTVGITFQNNATVSFTDPTRSTGGAATGTNVINPLATPGGTYANGSAVGGSNYASGSSTAEDVRLISGTTSLTISKTDGVSSVAAGSTTSYTVTVANLGPTAAPGARLTDPAVPGLNCTTVTCTSTAANMCPAGPTVTALQSTGLQITPTFPANSTATFVVTCGVTATGQ